MRSSFCRALQTGTVILGIFAVAGCSNTSNWKLPGSSWLSWGRSEPAASTVASQTPKSSQLPAPPSSLSTPQAAPTYTQTSPPSSAASVPSSPTSTHNPYGGTSSPSASGSPNTAQGFYSPDYHPAPPPSSPAASSPPPASGAPAHYGTPSAPSDQPSAHAIPAQPTGDFSGAGLPSREHPSARDSIYAAPASPGRSSASPYAGPPTGTPPPGWGDDAPSAVGDRDTMHGHLPPVQSEPSPAWPDSPSPSPSSPPTGGYRPGSTARTTPFGSSDSLQVAEGSGGERPPQASSESSSGSERPPSSMPSGYLPDAPGQQPSPGGSPPSFPSPSSPSPSFYR